MGAINMPFFEKSFFAPCAAHRPRDAITRATETHARETLEKYFCSGYEQMQKGARPLPFNSSIYHCRSPQLCPKDQATTSGSDMDDNFEIEETLVGYEDASKRLALVIALLLREGSGFEECINSVSLPVEVGHSVNSSSPPLTDVARYFFSFPSRCKPSFVSLVRCNDWRAVLLLFYFYRSAQLLLPRKHYWWSYRRAKVMGNVLKRRLEAVAGDLVKEGEEILGWHS